ncbi:uncharacterized protein LOC127766833 [Oryza glaberrima]|uniref:F-box associated domain-containing protein n=2 Tax=Oryza TaxID=4527 RepID=A0A0D3FG33_9ORYZ|nr:uncharacterized protein LOC127766833 [Oryza glaberrima]
MSLLRRFVFMVAKGSRRGHEQFYLLRRINMSRFFYPDKVSPVPVPGIEEAPLPPTCARFCAGELINGHMDFMLLARDKVLAVEASGRTTIYDDSFRVVRSGPVLKAPLYWPISVPVDDSGVYVLDSKHCFQKLVHDNSSCEDWTCEALPTAPREVRGGSRRAYAVVGGNSIWISNDGDGTYAYDISRRSWAKHAEWALPFSGRAEYVSEHKLWFGLARNSTGNPMCACDLAAAAEQGSPPVQRNIWQQDVRPRKGWVPRYSNLLHLGSARFCIVRIFAKPSPETEFQSEWDGPKREEVFAVLTAVEVVRSGELGKGLRMVKHKSVRYSLGDGYCKVQPLMVY